jgi:two-component system, NarL family, sensor histidine kinase UhpB
LFFKTKIFLKKRTCPEQFSIFCDYGYFYEISKYRRNPMFINGKFTFRSSTILDMDIEMATGKERSRIARDIHDHLGGNLVAIKMALALLTQNLPAENKTLMSKAQYIDTLVDRTIETIHRISMNLHPSILNSGLVAAIGWQTREFEKQFGIPCNFSTNENNIQLSPEQVNALFSIAQEAFTNIGKHAHASCVMVQLKQTKRTIHMKITDNGCGIETADYAKPASLGIRSMTERTSALGGILSIGKAKSTGSTVLVKIPLATTPK